ncbi:MAG: LysR family transcriptional regulator [Paracoccaceae bacterium]
MHSLNWDDLRFVLAVVEHGSLSAAARQLGVNHATVLRRVGAFEARIGSPIFHRTAQGYQILPDQLRLIEATREVGHAINSVERLGAGLETQLSGQVRVTSTDTVCMTLLPEILKDLQSQAEGLHLSLVCSNTHLNLSLLEAEVTIRPAARLPEELVGAQAGYMRFAAYKRAADSVSDRWIGPAGPLTDALPMVWLDDFIKGTGYVARTDSFMVARELAVQGVGQALLPCLIAESDSGLERIDRFTPDIKVPIWVASHEELAKVSRLRLVRSSLLEALQQHQAQLDPQF